MSNTNRNYHKSIVLVFWAVLLQCSIVTKAQSPNAILKKADSVYYSDPYRSYEYCLEAEQAAQKNNDELLEYASLICKARFHLLMNQLNTARAELKKAIGYFRLKNEKQKLAKCYNLMSILSERQGNHSAVYYYGNETIRLYKELDMAEGEYTASVNLCLWYVKDAKYDQAQELLNGVEKLLDRISEPASFFYYLNCGDLKLRTKKYAESIKALNKAIELAVSHKMADSEITALTYLGKAHHANGNTKLALLKLDVALEKALELSLKYEQKELYLLYKEIYTGLNKQDKLNEVNMRLDELEAGFKQDSIQKAENVHQQEIEQQKREKEIADLQKKLEQKKLQQTKPSSFNLPLIGGVACVTLLIVGVFFYTTRKKKSN